MIFMAKKGSVIGSTLNLIVLALIIYLGFKLNQIGFFNSFINSISHNLSSTSVFTTIPGIQNFTTIPANGSGQASIYANYALQLINKDRQQYGLQNVTLSNTTSAQQHAISMLQENYFSHWDMSGLKPYMRYTLVGGRGSVTENVAYQTSSACIAFLCSGNINPTNALQTMEYNMIYNDSACCNNGHKDNILYPFHNQVSIGVAYNSSTVYFVEDFVDSYISWLNATPSFANGEMYLSGTINNSYSLSSISIGYDSPVTNMTKQQLAATSEYNYGNQIAGVVQNSNYYYKNLTTIVADSYATNGHNFNAKFNLQNLVKSYGPGEYTVLVWIGTPGAISSGFVGATYTLFINSQGEAYVPNSV